MDLETWFKKLTQGASLRDAAEQSGISKSTLSRNLDANSMTPETVIALCRAYGRSPVTGLIETGYLEKLETDGVSVPYALEQATNEQLLNEVIRRSDPEARYLFGEDEDTIGLAPNAEVFEFPSPETTPDVDGLSYVADTSIDEDAQRAKEEGEDDWPQ